MMPRLIRSLAEYPDLLARVAPAVGLERAAVEGLATLTS